MPKYYKNTLVCYSWSKALSVPGERMGYVLVSDQMEEHDLVYAAIAGAGRALGYVSAPSLFQRVCAECADDTSDISVYEKNKEILVRGLRDLGFFCVEPQGTFYMFPRTLIPDDIAFCEKAKDFNLLIVPGTGFGCPGHVRISYCVPTERAERSLGGVREAGGGLSMIIDFHTHTFPEKIALRTLDHLAGKSQSRYYSDGTAESLAASMKKAGIDFSVNLPVMTAPQQADRVNDSLLRAMPALEEQGILNLWGMHPEYEKVRGETGKNSKKAA